MNVKILPIIIEDKEQQTQCEKFLNRIALLK